MIEWIKYDPANPPEHWKTFLITKGMKISEAYLDTDKTNGLQWWGANTDEELMHIGVTHYAHINLPGEEDTNV